jgi:PadR family transcriptional regulator, regulatory protein PadR
MACLRQSSTLRYRQLSWVRLTPEPYICRVVPVKMRMSPQTVLVLMEFLQAPSHWNYGYDISRDTGLKSGTLYPILMRLADRALLETRWETTEAGKPPRHMYRLTPTGLQLARQESPSKTRRARMQPAFSGVKS